MNGPLSRDSVFKYRKTYSYSYRSQILLLRLQFKVQTTLAAFGNRHRFDVGIKSKTSILKTEYGESIKI